MSTTQARANTRTGRASGDVIVVDYQTPTFATPLAITTSTTADKTQVFLALTGIITITGGTTNPLIGDQLEFYFTGDTVDRVVTFSTGFVGLATVTVAGSSYAVCKFFYNGTKWVSLGYGTVGLADIQTPAYGSTLSVTTTVRMTRLLPAQLTGAVTINMVTTNAVAGDVLIYAAGADGTNRVTTFGTNMKSAGTLTCTASKYVGATFVFDGTNWIETGRAITA